MKKQIQGTSEHNKAMSAAKTDEEKSSVKTKKQNATTGLRTCNNILAMTNVLHAKAPSFIGDKSVSLSWKEATKTLASTTTGFYLANNDRVKRPATGAGNNVGAKKGRVPSHQVVKKAFEGVSYGGGRGSQRGHGRGQGKRGGGGGGRSRGRGYC
ncbi:apoptosis inhibitor 5-like protein API5 [Brassica napus]|uniref:apoptosis inhibitor 5-like protein API5 n=1 Tax=Brassica napus TaxID=3708 RepID=UPI00207A321C|nr:apoptosis inhibitor 5-like protein API5 [Brassica napus]